MAGARRSNQPNLIELVELYLASSTRVAGSVCGRTPVLTYPPWCLDKTEGLQFVYWTSLLTFWQRWLLLHCIDTFVDTSHLRNVGHCQSYGDVKHVNVVECRLEQYHPFAKVNIWTRRYSCMPGMEHQGRIVPYLCRIDWPSVKQGWTLPVSNPPTRFSVKQKPFLNVTSSLGHTQCVILFVRKPTRGFRMIFE